MNNKIKNVNVTLTILLILVFIIALIAPFTFQKPQVLVELKLPLDNKKIIKKVTELPLPIVVLPDFSDIHRIQDKKRQFFNYLRPAVNIENYKVKRERHQLKIILAHLSLGKLLDEENEVLFKMLIDKYNIRNKSSQLQQAYDLLSKVDVIPQALVLVQAANESAWGTSRFARIGLNFFGIWCYRQGCGMVPKGRNSNERHEVASFNSVEQGIERYLHNINTHAAYKKFRMLRAQLREQKQPLSADVLVAGLLPYSERGVDYVLELTSMLRHNKKYLSLAVSE